MGDDDEDAEDRQALVPHNHSILGLKVADEEEALTVRRVGTAVLGLLVLIGIHFIVHVAHGGHVLHSVGHLLLALLLPMLGYIAVSQRSTKAAWGFHLMSVISTLVHTGHAWHQISRLAELQAPGVDCELYAAECEGDPAELDLGAFTPDGGSWRCHDGTCITAERYCDGVFNCYDRSDEADCEATALGDDPNALLKAVKEEEGLERCREIFWKREFAPRLKVWWLFMTPPMWALCIFASYHSLEFYVQLRVRRLAAKLDHLTAEATIFERPDNDGSGL